MLQVSSQQSNQNLSIKNSNYNSKIQINIISQLYHDIKSHSDVSINNDQLEAVYNFAFKIIQTFAGIQINLDDLGKGKVKCCRVVSLS